jgi:DNA-binding PadR family transcriptional regulator
VKSTKQAPRTCACLGKNLDRFIQPIILSILLRQTCTGYAIIKQMRDYETFFSVGPDPAGIYRYLKTMEQKGLITRETSTGEDAVPYRITEEGRDCLTNWVQTLGEYTQTLHVLIEQLGELGGAAMKMPSMEPFYPVITAMCLDQFQKQETLELLPLAEALMQIEGLPIHCPAHHYIVPASLLTVCRKERKESVQQLEQDLSAALERARNVLPGFCGFYGACGAAVGMGIFWSIMTECTPYAKESWSAVNRATGETLLEISKHPGPRCCKRTTFAALESAAKQIQTNLALGLDLPAIHCAYSEKNPSCIRESCCYFPSKSSQGTENVYGAVQLV